MGRRKHVNEFHIIRRLPNVNLNVAHLTTNSCQGKRVYASGFKVLLCSYSLYGTRGRFYGIQDNVY